MQQDRLRRADHAGRRLRAAHSFGELRAENRGDTEAAHAFDDVDEALPGLSDRRELIDDQQHSLARGLRPTAHCVNSSTRKRARYPASYFNRNPSSRK